MISKQRSLAVIIAGVIAVLLMSFGCSQSGISTPTAVTFVSAEQTGGTSGTSDSTGLILTFSTDPTTLSVEDITVTGATKGALSGTGTTRSLVISDITVANGEEVTVDISSSERFLISGSPKTAVVYKAPASVIFVSAEQTGGISGTSDSTGLILTFSADPTTLSVEDITVTGATKGVLSGSGTTRSLAIYDITVINGADVTVDITSPEGYEIIGSSRTAVVYKDTLTSVMCRELVSITGGTYTQTDGTSSFSHTISDFSLGRYEVTYELWYTVYQWAISSGYHFANAGREGHDGVSGEAPTSAKYEPVTNVNWRDAMVWCNAYSELSGFTPVYTYSSEIIRDSRDTNATACDSVVCNWNENGYRLPSEGEWQYAASNKGSTPYNYASGATADYNNDAETQKVAWYYPHSDLRSHPVGTTVNPSALTLRDMSGNVWEWCWDWSASYPGSARTDYRGSVSGTERIRRGGNFWYTADRSIIGFRGDSASSYVNMSVGFRVARTN